MSIRIKFLRLLTGVILALSFILAIGFTAKASGIEYTDPDTGYKLIIQDDEDLITDSEEKALAETMKPALKYGHIMYVSNPSDNYHSESVAEFAGNIYYSKVHNESGTLLLVDFSEREIYVASDGNNYEVLTYSKAASIVDNVYRKFSDGNYYEGISLCMEQIISVLSGQKIAQPMKHISNAILSILVGMIVCAIIVTSTMGIKKASAKDVLNTVKVKMTNPKVSTIKTDTTKTYIGGSGGGGGGFFSGGGGGGFSGGGGGGGFSGGGAGHKF